MPRPDLGGAQRLWVINSKGIVVARVGENEQKYGDDVSKLPAVQKALQGAAGTDALVLDNQVLRVAVAPIRNSSGTKNYGAVLVGVKTAENLGALVKQDLGVEFGVLQNDNVFASTISIPADLQAKVNGKRAEMRDNGRTQAFVTTIGNNSYIATAALFDGEAGRAGATYLLLDPVPLSVGPLGPLSDLSFQEFRWGAFP